MENIYDGMDLSEENIAKLDTAWRTKQTNAKLINVLDET
jgi:hypothetical protein